MRLTIIIVLYFNMVTYSQNLVPNASFEEIGDSISGFADSPAEFMNSTKYWTVPNKATPDLITPSFEEKFIQPPPPHSGSNVVGISCMKYAWEDKYSSECIGIQLSQALKPNRTYHVEYWIRRANCIAPSKNIDEFMNTNFGVLFTLDSIKTNNPDMLYGIPQMKGDSQLLVTNKEWVKVSKYFSPKEKYSYLYLGQFRNKGAKKVDYMKSYYVIDDVSVVQLDNFEALDEDTELPTGSIVPLNNINFISGTTKLSDKKSYALLKKLAAYLKLNPKIRICINGHTDSKGSKKYNRLLSEKRAKTIAQILVKSGINKDKIEWKGYGETNPIADNETEKGRSINRRVEFEIIE